MKTVSSLIKKYRAVPLFALSVYNSFSALRELVSDTGLFIYQIIISLIVISVCILFSKIKSKVAGLLLTVFLSFACTLPLALLSGSIENIRTIRTEHAPLLKFLVVYGMKAADVPCFNLALLFLISVMVFIAAKSVNKDLPDSFSILLILFGFSGALFSGLLGIYSISYQLIPVITISTGICSILYSSKEYFKNSLYRLIYVWAGLSVLYIFLGHAISTIIY